MTDFKKIKHTQYDTLMMQYMHFKDSGSQRQDVFQQITIVDTVRSSTGGVKIFPGTA